MHRLDGRGRAWRIALVLAAAGGLSCKGGFGGPATISKDGYRAILLFSPEDRFSIAVRGESRRVEGEVEGSLLVKVARPDLAKSWQFRPATKKIYETVWSPTDELIPGYPLGPGFDAQAYADRFRASLRRIDDATHGLHPCERYEMTLPSGDIATVWAARDLERLVVRIEHAKKDSADEHQAFTDTQLLDIRIGAPEKLFQKPEGFTPVRSYAELR
jgi:hypothetical protein